MPCRADLFRSLTILVAAIAFLALTTGEPFAKGRSLIRDAEIESTIRIFATPLLETAGLSPQAVRIYIIQDASLNAFVAGGQNIFLHTGLLIRSETPAQLIGVLAHEIGHITGGHLPRTSDALRSASNAGLVSAILGGVTAVATGRVDVGIAVMSGGTALVQATMLEYSRTQESAADVAAVELLESTGQSARGLAEFLRILDNENLLAPERRSPYARTHPLNWDRVAFVENHVAKSSMAERREPVGYQDLHDRMVAKLSGFLQSPEQTFKTYAADDRRVASRYARAIATYRAARVDDALAMLETLIGEHPKDGHFADLRGQILFEAGRIDEARTAYRRALLLLGNEALVASSLARVELALETAEANESARRHMEHAIKALREAADAWHLLAIARGRTGAIGLASLALAEEALLTGRSKDAEQQARRAQAHLSEDSPGHLRARDIEALAEQRIRGSRR